MCWLIKEISETTIETITTIVSTADHFQTQINVLRTLLGTEIDGMTSGLGFVFLNTYSNSPDTLHEIDRVTLG